MALGRPIDTDVSALRQRHAHDTRTWCLTLRRRDGARVDVTGAMLARQQGVSFTIAL
jgi:hypothetical protein